MLCTGFVPITLANDLGSEHGAGDVPGSKPRPTLTSRIVYRHTDDGDRSSPLGARPAPPSLPRTQGKPVPGGLNNPWMHMTSSSASASTTGRCAPPSPCTSLPRSLPCGTLHALTSQSSPLDCPWPCAQDFDRLRHFLSNEISLRAGGVDARARGAGSAPRRAMCLLLRAMRPRATVGAFHGTVRVSLVGWCCELALGACAL